MFQSEFKQKKTKETIQSIQQRNSESNRIQTETGKGFKLEADAKQVKARPELYDK
ncbi:transcriptional regulator [Leptospira sp. FAT2]|uniref:transcriptional regulator n=1 Tax=Leptospira sanjuanensis TaxID=2879643 RepID=UPI001EE87189|nr:transcriptional regulator [Leptospira sanjuanensis]MCG6194032.1 transcriptional regulator [Leptospira sanjuanensis]